MIRKSIEITKLFFPDFHERNNTASDELESLKLIMWSINQDIIQAILPKKVTVRKQVLLSTTVRTLTGNKELVKLLNRLGHGCNYNKILQIETDLCHQKLENFSDDEVPLPSSIQACIPTVLAFDNIDRLEETISGSGTSHRINGIIIQPPNLESCSPSTSQPVQRLVFTIFQNVNFIEPNFMAPPGFKPVHAIT